MGRLINYNSAISRDPSNLNFPLLDPSIVRNYNSNSNGGGNGGNNMEERIIKLEADVGSIKEIVKDHNNRFDKIDARLESSEKLINIKLDNLLDNLKENYISYKGLFGMLAVFTAVIGFLIKFIH